MKRLRYTAWLALIAAFCLCLSGCGAKKEASIPADDGSMNIYASFYPIYALADLITDGVENVNLHCLVQPQDGCLRAYQLSDWDLVLIDGAADAIFIGGSGLESFESILYALGEDGPVVSALLYDMNLKHQMAKNSSEDTDSHWIGENPHIYMDVDAAQELCRRICATMVLLDPVHEKDYIANLQKAQNSLADLKEEIQQNLSSLQDKKVIAMNEALVYADTVYGLSIELCFERENGENIDGKDLENCLAMLENCEANVILMEKQAPQALCSALEAAGYRIAQMDVLSTHRSDEGAEGYFRAHRANVQAIMDAFSKAS